MNIRRLISLMGLLVIVLVTAGCSSEAVQTVVVTVVNTVPVEVTRMVEVQQTVEVIQEVVVTEIVEVQVPVTVTPVPEPEETTTSEPSPVASVVSGGEVPVAQATPTFDVNEFQNQKIQGFAPLKVINETESLLTVTVQGAAYLEVTVGSHNSAIQVIPEGEYTYTVWEEGELRYSGTLRLTNPDKHELVIYNNRVVFKVP